MNGKQSTTTGSLGGKSQSQKGSFQQGQTLNERERDKAGGAAQDISRDVKDLTHDVREKGREAVSWARREGEQAVRGQVKRLASQADDFAKALDGAADKLENEGHETAARYAREACNRLHDAAGFVRERDLSALYRETENFARRRLDLFLGGMFVAGLAAARFLKASRPEIGSESDNTFSESGSRYGESSTPSSPSSSFSGSLGGSSSFEESYEHRNDEAISQALMPSDLPETYQPNREERS